MERARQKPKMYLLTRHYPFGNGEPFVGNEIPYLMEKFDLTIVTDDRGEVGNRLAGQKEVKIVSVPLPSWPTKDERISALKLSILSWAMIKDMCSIIVQYRKNAEKYLRDVINQIALGEQYYQYLIENDIIPLNEEAVIYFFWNEFKTFPFLYRSRKNRKWTLISRIHGVDFYNERHPLGRQPLKPMNQKLDGLVFLSEYARKYYRDTFDRKVDSYSAVFPLGVINDLGIEPYSNDKEEILLCSCSRIVEVKRLDKIVDALSLVEGIKIRWIHIGDGGLQGELKTLIKDKLERKNNISVELVGGIDNKAVFSFYKEIKPDAYILVSDSEGTPVSMMEAMSCGIPIITVSVGSIPEMLQGTHNIIMSADASTKEIAEAIQQFSEYSNSMRTEISRQNIEAWKDRYDSDNNYRKYAEYILELHEAKLKKG